MDQEGATTETTKDKEEDNTTFSLPRPESNGSKVRVVPVNRPRRGFPAEHEASHSVNNSYREYGAPIDADTGHHLNPLKKTEQEFFEDPSRSGMNLKPGDLDPTLPPEKNYWTNFKVKLRKEEPRILDLSQPVDYLVYKVLILNKDQIAPSGEKKMERPTYMYAVQSVEYETESEAERADEKIEAYGYLNMIKDSRYKLERFLRAYGRQIGENASKMWMKSEAYKVAEQEPNKLVEIMEDPHFDDKVLIEEALDAGELRKTRDGFVRPPDQDMGRSYNEVIDRLNNNRYADIRHDIEIGVKKWRGEVEVQEETQVHDKDKGKTVEENNVNEQGAGPVSENEEEGDQEDQQDENEKEDNSEE